MIRIVHTSDLHLDKNAFPGDERLNRLRKKEQRALFASIMMYVRSNKVDVLFICGDLLDSQNPERETGELILREFENTPDAEIFITPGRADAFRPGCFYDTAAFPSNVHIFKDEQLTAVRLDRLNADVYGYGFTHRNLKRSRLAVAPTLDRQRFNLFCGYASLHGKENACPVSGEEIARSGFDYLAFGSEHDPSALLEAGGCFYAMSGCPEGTDFFDVGRKSVRIAALDRKEGRTLFNSKCITLSHKRFETLCISAEGGSSIELADRVYEFVRANGLDADCCLRVSVSGNVPVSFRIDESAFDRVKSRLAYLEIVDATTMVCDPAKKLEDPGKCKIEFKEVFACFAAQKTEDPELRSAILKEGLAALENEG